MTANGKPVPRARICREIVADVGCVDLQTRRAVLDLPNTKAGHRDALASLSVLNRVETGGAGRAPPPPRAAPLRVVFWNAERLKFIAGSAAFLAGLDADVILLAEVDIGMARSGQKHTVRELAQALGMAYVYGTEFIELGLGDQRERGWFAGEENRCGLHGGAILSRLPLSDPAVIRLPEAGDWFDGRRGERRVGGRVAVTARATVGGTPTLFAAVHLESHGSPASRATEIAQLLPALDACADGGPIILGGDFNTNTVDRDGPDWSKRRRQLGEDHPGRLLAPEAYEPMFALLEAAGYDRHSCNTPGATQRTRPDGTPPPPFGKIDWLFCRDLGAAAPAIHPALSDDGVTAISDHEAISVLVSPINAENQAGQTV